MAIAFERATELVAAALARCRAGYEDSPPPTRNEQLLAGHIVGSLRANKLINTEGEKWVVVDSVERRIFADVLRDWWTFDDHQQHTHSWHSRENFIEKRLPELLAMFERR